MKTGAMPQPQTLALPGEPYTYESAEGGLNLPQMFSALRRRALLIAGITALVTGGAFVRAMIDTPVFQSQAEILTQPFTAESRLVSSVPETLTSQAPVPRVVIDNTILRVLTSPRVIQIAVDKLKTRYPDLTYGDIVRNLKLQPSGKDSNVLQLSYQGEDPEQVQTILGAVSQAFLDYSLQSRQADIKRGIEFVEQQLPILQKNVENLQANLQRLRLRNDLVDPESRGQQLTGQISAFTQAQLENEVQLKQLRTVYADLRRQLASRSQEDAASSALKDAPRFQSVLGELLKVDTQLAEASTIFLDTTPEIQTLRELRQNLLGILAREGGRVEAQIQSQINELEARDRALKQTIRDLNGNVKTLSGIAREYTDIQRELEIATENLNQFLAKREALRIDSAQREIPWELITPATLPTPSMTSVQNQVLLGLVLGLLLGLGTAIWLERMSDVLHSSRDIKRIAKLPLLGVIPFQEQLNRPAEEAAVWLQSVTEAEIVSVGNNTIYRAIPFFEAFRSLYTNIRLLSPDNPARSLVISSPASTDGKSVVSIGLAQAAAAMGQRVLLVDADLRYPRLHQYLGVPNDQGLTDVISARVGLKAALHQSSLERNLYVLTAGAAPPDATRFLASQRMQSFMAQVQKYFDLIIYDTPPLLGFADAYLLTPQTEGMVLVVGLGKLRAAQLEEALEQLGVSGASVLGIAANGSREPVLATKSYDRQTLEIEDRRKRNGKVPHEVAEELVGSVGEKASRE